MNLRFIKSSEKKDILAQLQKQFGISELRFLLLESGKEKIRGFSGSLSKDEIFELGKIANIENIGIYLLRKEDTLRLSFDATQLLASQISKNIIDISEEQAREWLRGHDLNIQAAHGTIVIRYGTDFLGCGKSTGLRIANHVPKERRLKK
jgi:NOL1/NOP2/fmu family ribosome biogenesis protein